MITLEITHSLLGHTLISGTPEEISNLLKLLEVSSNFDTSKNKIAAIDSRSHPKHAPKKVSKRQGVLNVMRILRDMGVDAPKTAQILEIYEKTYPGQDSTHMAQVLRDLANKTNLIVRESWGCFKLSDV